jgi:predicted Ser/Thr protein kinase
VSEPGEPEKEPLERLAQLGSEIREAYARHKRVMSFDEYYALIADAPHRHARSAPQYLSDAFEYYGAEEVHHPRGTVTRWKLFDAPWEGGKDRLVGQEEVQGRIYRAIQNFVREGRVNKLILLHGPNGSAKSTLVSCMARALEHYSTLEEGAVYRFNWIFPSQKLSKSSMGFGGARGETGAGSFAYLDEDQIDAKIVDELRDHPLLLIPPNQRRALLADRLAAQTDPKAKAFRVSEYIQRGDLGPKNKRIFEALLASYRGDYLRVLRHVQIERVYLSRRYRQALCTIEPQLAVDARSRQVTMDRSLGALPASLQSVTLHEYAGELVDANRGLIEYADLLKRPLEAYKYLLGTVEHGNVPVDSSILYLDTVFIGASNEGHLAAFKEMPEFQSFKGRLELVRVPYLLEYPIEQRIYDEQLRPADIGKHIAPHATGVTALWSVLTRMRKPLPEKYPKGLSELVSKLSPLEKAELYARAQTPDGLSPEQTKELTAAIDKIWSESDAYPNYEGRTGASPREVKTLLLNAAANPRFACVSPLAIFEEMEELVKNVSVYEFLKQEPLPGGFHENKKFISVVRERFLERTDDDLRLSMGLVEEKEHIRIFDRYISHVSNWMRKEKVRNPLTGRLEDPDEDFMTEIEKSLGVGTRKNDFRQDLITRIGAWSIDHPNERPEWVKVFPKQFSQLREAYFEQNKKLVKKIADDILVYLTDGAKGMDDEVRARVEQTLKTLRERFGYCDRCARDAISNLVRKRYALAKN